MKEANNTAPEKTISETSNIESANLSYMTLEEFKKQADESFASKMI